GIEFPIAMGAEPGFDPEATDLYNIRAMKYPWAEDAYVAFPLWFFHYYGDGPVARQILAEESRGMGTGLVETQLATSRDGLNWNRYPRPAYIPVGDHEGFSVKRPYILFGMVRRGDRIFQYSYTRSSYHDAWSRNTPPAVVHRLSQRLDGFVSLRAPYTGGEFETRLIRFKGKRLELNIDTGATGYAQIGFLDETGRSIPGYGVDDCVYINSNSTDHTVEWLRNGTDLSSVSGRLVRLVVSMRGTDLYAIQLALGLTSVAVANETVALWLFDEPEWLYPSHTIDSSAGLDSPMVLGLGGTLTQGKWGNALSTKPHPPVDIPDHGEETASLNRLAVPAGRTQEPLTWHNANFAALMTGGERHLRKQVGFVNPTDTDLNLGDFDWTVEFWFRSDSKAKGEGVVFEIGSGPRGENDQSTRLTANTKSGIFTFSNAKSNSKVSLKSAAKPLKGKSWNHFAFTYQSSNDTLSLFANGRKVESTVFKVERLESSDESYMSFGRDGLWNKPLAGTIDELRFSNGLVYSDDFKAPGSFAPEVPEVELTKGVPLRFGEDSPKNGTLDFGHSKHVFWDDSLLESSKGLTFNTHQPKYIERVVEGLLGQVRKHLTVIEDEQGMIRIYHGVADDYLGIRVSHDGVNFVAPDTGYHWKGDKNIVIPEPAPMGRPMIDPNGPPEHRWKYVSGLEGRGVYLYTSPDGWKWKRHRTAVLPFRSGSQSSLYYDEQRQLYVGFQRTGHPMTAGGGTSREFVISETNDVYSPWPVDPLTQAEAMKIAEKRPLRYPIPWWMDN
ncbi:MAG: LamG-like jellyroll fold domain-containing protein, partial [Verrucomicrobiia bacterium]